MMPSSAWSWYGLMIYSLAPSCTARWRLWRDRVWAARESLANVEHQLENPPRPASERLEDGTDVDAARAQLTELEAVLQESLMALTHDLTLFIVAHRMSTLDICDRVMVIVDGRLVAFDTQATLESENAYYRAASMIAAGGAGHSA